MCHPAYSQHIDGVGNCVCVSSAVIKPRDTEQSRGGDEGGEEKGDDEGDDKCFLESFPYYSPDQVGEWGVGE